MIFLFVLKILINYMYKSSTLHSTSGKLSKVLTDPFILFVVIVAMSGIIILTSTFLIIMIGIIELVAQYLQEGYPSKLPPVSSPSVIMFLAEELSP
ncbi:hypothetical protein SAMN06265171_105289 [Chryseobacterium rhizoplanae]|uniref:Uncharacterized protein n=1 Tax=Chryseobacterium rhizoplanae TaxID=1609531 RepID=A0A521DP57_9FLAO|nr:hypothetical protein SAMN06265171_105289 [Chryseobacterium rhizoplanae]